MEVERIMDKLMDEDIKNKIKLEVREYFDYFLKEIHPKLMKEHGHSCPHGQFVNKFKWVMIGALGATCMMIPSIAEHILNFFKMVK